jgi:hypothetical protein
MSASGAAVEPTEEVNAGGVIAAVLAAVPVLHVDDPCITATITAPLVCAEQHALPAAHLHPFPPWPIRSALGLISCSCYCR